MAERSDGYSSETLLAPCTRRKKLQRKMTKDYYWIGVQENIGMFSGEQSSPQVGAQISKLLETQEKVAMASIKKSKSLLDLRTLSSVETVINTGFEEQSSTDSKENTPRNLVNTVVAKELKMLKKEVNVVRGIIDVLRKQNKDLESKVNSQNETMQELKANERPKLKKLRLQKTKSQEEVEKAKKSSKILEEELDALKKEMQNKEKENEALREELSHVKEEMKTNVDFCRSYEKTIKNLIEGQGNKERVIAEQNKDLIESKANYQAAETKLDIKDSTLNECKRRNQSLMEEQEAKEVIINEIKMELHKSETENNRIKEEIEELKVLEKEDKVLIATLREELQTSREEVQVTKEESERKVKSTEENWKTAFLNFKRKNEEELKSVNEGIATLSSKLTMKENEKRQSLKNSEDILQIMQEKIDEKDNFISALHNKMDIMLANFEEQKQLKEKKSFFGRLFKGRGSSRR